MLQQNLQLNLSSCHIGQPREAKLRVQLSPPSSHKAGTRDAAEDKALNKEVSGAGVGGLRSLQWLNLPNPPHLGQALLLGHLLMDPNAKSTPAVEALPARFSNSGEILHVDAAPWLLLLISQATHICVQALDMCVYHGITECP